MKHETVSMAEATTRIDAIFAKAIREAPNEDARQFLLLQQKLNHAYTEWARDAIHALGHNGGSILAVVCEALAAIANMAIHGMPEEKQATHRLIFAHAFVDFLRNQRMAHGVHVRAHDA